MHVQAAVCTHFVRLGTLLTFDLICNWFRICILQGQVVQVSHDANQYATAKSVTQVIFTTSAIASNVTLWNQVRLSCGSIGSAA